MTLNRSKPCKQCQRRLRSKAGGKLCNVCYVRAHGKCRDCGEDRCWAHSHTECDECGEDIRVRDADIDDDDPDDPQFLCKPCYLFRKPPIKKKVKWSIQIS